MFLHLCVILFTGGEGVSLIETPSWTEIPLGPRPPPDRKPPGQRPHLTETPRDRDHPGTETP